VLSQLAVRPPRETILLSSIQNYCFNIMNFVFRSPYWIDVAGDGFFAALAATSTTCAAANLAVLAGSACRAGAWCSEGRSFNRRACEEKRLRN
jgi:hypothetical protein